VFRERLAFRETQDQLVLKEALVQQDPRVFKEPLDLQDLLVL
jgi:hypothetical protein